MKARVLPATLAAAFIFGAAGVSAQTVVIAPEERQQIVTYVKKEKPATVKVKEIRVGTMLPKDVQVRSFPATVKVKYQYVYLGDRIALVNPNREVVEIIDVR